MKSKTFYLLSCALFLNSLTNAYSQNKIVNTQAIPMLRHFYIAYNTAWATTSGDVLVRKLWYLQAKYCSNGLRKKLKQEFKVFGLDHDYLINDQYTDVEHLKTLSVKKDSTAANAYIVSYIAPTRDPANKPIDFKVVIHVKLKKEKNGYRIVSTDMI